MMTTPFNDSPPTQPKRRRPQRPGKLPVVEKPAITIQPDPHRPNQSGLLDRLLEWLSRKSKDDNQ